MLKLIFVAYEFVSPWKIYLFTSTICIWKISYGKCEVPQPVYDTFANSHLFPSYVGSSTDPEAHSCDEFVSQPWFAIQKWRYYTTKQFVKAPDDKTSLRDAVGLQYSSDQQASLTGSLMEKRILAHRQTWHSEMPLEWETLFLQEYIQWSK